MIVRIQGEGQFRVPSALLDQLNDLDNQLVLLASGDDEGGFRKTFGEMLELVRSQGSPLALEDLHPSDVVLPSADTDLAEAKTVFADEGLIPG